MCRYLSYIIQQTVISKYLFYLLFFAHLSFLYFFVKDAYYF